MVEDIRPSPDGNVVMHARKRGRERRRHLPSPRGELSFSLVSLGVVVGLLVVAVIVVLPELLSEPWDWNAPVSPVSSRVIVWTGLLVVALTAMTWVLTLGRRTGHPRGPSTAVLELKQYALHEWDARSHLHSGQP